ncbi:hypothetical protein TNCV_2623261 [Trichonephila clavipes]|nr:hypothetical protein TNCV_2623261 [Trichonephila clavipes]
MKRNNNEIILHERAPDNNFWIFWIRNCELHFRRLLRKRTFNNSNCKQLIRKKDFRIHRFVILHVETTSGLLATDLVISNHIMPNSGQGHCLVAAVSRDRAPVLLKNRCAEELTRCAEISLGSNSTRWHGVEVQRSAS